MEDETQDEWRLWWDARMEAMEGVLGKSEGVVGHAVIPFHLGADLGGAADIVFFRKHVPGAVAATAELIGYDEQVPNKLGHYELMICERENVDWGAKLISRLAYYTLEAELNPGDTMGIGPAVPDGSTIAALLFCDYARFEVRGRRAGLLLCLGITEPELEACLNGRLAEVEAALKSEGVYPFTDLFRPSVALDGMG